MTENKEQVENTASAEASAEVKKGRNTKVGKVVSDKMDKTIVVEVEYLKKHRLYKKSIRRHSRFKAHDEDNSAKVGDLVRIEESRPYSREKHFKLAEIIKKGVAL